MSLKTRVRLFVVLLMFSVVTALSLVHLYTLGANGFEDALQRAQMAAHDVSTMVTSACAKTLRPSRRERRSEDPRKLWAGAAPFRRRTAADFSTNTVSTSSKAIVEILVADGATDRIIADSLRFRVGEAAPNLPDFERWSTRSPWEKLAQIVSYKRHEYEVGVPIGVQGQSTPVLQIKVVLSSALLRDILMPQVRSIGLIFLGALLLSMLVAVSVSNLVLRPLDTSARPSTASAAATWPNPTGCPMAPPRNSRPCNPS